MTRSFSRPEAPTWPQSTGGPGPALQPPSAATSARVLRLVVGTGITTSAELSERTRAELLLRDAVDHAYRHARRYVFDRGLNESSPELLEWQRELLASLSAAEEALRAFRHGGRSVGPDGGGLSAG